MEGWIKLYRKFLQWEWSDIPEMVTLFIHLILLANTSDGEWHGLAYTKGQLITSVGSLSKKTGLSVQQVRTCLNRLKSTNEITIKSTNKNTIISICKYESYQVNTSEDNKQNNEQTNNQITNNQQTNNKQITTDKEYKNVKNIEKENIKEKDATGVATNEQRLMARKENFLNELSQYVAVYGDKTIRDFANYWTEANRSNTKMRYEMQPTWNTAMRLATWARREKPESTTQQRTGKTAPMQAFENMMQKFAGQQKPQTTEDIDFETIG